MTTAQKIAIKNASAQFAELQRILDDWNTVAINDITPELLIRLSLDIEECGHSIQKAVNHWKSTL